MRAKALLAVLRFNSMNDPIQVSMLLVQILALVALLLYVWDTRKIRKAADEQIKVSQALVQVAMDQVEGLSKPCLTIWSKLRDAADTMLEMDGAVGSMVVREDGGRFVAQNIGNGVALNVRYNIKRTDQPSGPHGPKSRYLPNVLAGQAVAMSEPVSTYSGDYCEVVFRFNSIGGREYQTTVTMSNLVITDFSFK